MHHHQHTCRCQSCCPAAILIPSAYSPSVEVRSDWFVAMCHRFKGEISSIPQWWTWTGTDLNLPLRWKLGEREDKRNPQNFSQVHHLIDAHTSSFVLIYAHIRSILYVHHNTKRSLCAATQYVSYSYMRIYDPLFMYYITVQNVLYVLQPTQYVSYSYMRIYDPLFIYYKYYLYLWLCPNCYY